MVPPAPVNPQIEQQAKKSLAELLSGARATGSFLRTFGFHVLVVLLGIALAFM
jgi:hypothetical protein